MKNNTGFVDAVAELARRAGCKLTICPQDENRNDRWIQVLGPPGSTSPDTVLEAEGLACPHTGAAGDTQEDWGSAGLPRALLFLILDLELSLTLRTFWRLGHPLTRSIRAHTPWPQQPGPVGLHG